MVVVSPIAVVAELKNNRLSIAMASRSSGGDLRVMQIAAHPSTSQMFCEVEGFFVGRLEESRADKN